MIFREEEHLIDFEWDPTKAQRNLYKHGVSFDEGATVFLDPLGITVHDPSHSRQESRYLTIGSTSMGRMIVLSHTDRQGRIRIISARELTRKERKAYENESKG